MTTVQRETLGIEIMKEVKRYDDGNGLTRRQLVDNILILFDQQGGPPTEVGNIQCECEHPFMDHQKPPVGTPWDICSFPCVKCDCQEFVASPPAEDEAEAVLRAYGTSGKEVVNEFIERLLRDRLALENAIKNFIRDRGYHEGEHVLDLNVCSRCDQSYVRAEEVLDKVIENTTATSSPAPAETEPTILPAADWGTLKVAAEEILAYLNFDCSLDAVQEDASAIAYMILKCLPVLTASENEQNPPKKTAFEIWWKGQIARDFVHAALTELEKVSGPKLIAGEGSLAVEVTAISAARRALDSALSTLDSADTMVTATPAERTRVAGEQENATKTIDWLGDMEVRRIESPSDSARLAAEEIADRWFRSDLPIRAQVQSTTRIKLRILSEEVIGKHFAAVDNDADACTCNDLTEVQRAQGDHYDDCPRTTKGDR